MRMELLVYYEIVQGLPYKKNGKKNEDNIKI